MKHPTRWISLAATLVAALATAQTSPSTDNAKARAASKDVQDAEPTAGQPAASERRAPPRQASSPAKAAGTGPPTKAQDRLDLETTQITGNRELPKVMVVVPWKRSDIGDLVGRPVNSLVDEALQPVDREVFRREIDYYGALTPDQRRSETRVTAESPKERAEK
jgi:hypothetical protein